MGSTQQTLTKPLLKGMIPATRIFHPENSKFFLKQAFGRLNKDLAEYKGSPLFIGAEIQILDLLQLRALSYLNIANPKYKVLRFSYIRNNRKVVGLLGDKVSSLYSETDPSQEVSVSSFVDQIETVLYLYQDVYDQRMAQARK